MPLPDNLTVYILPAFLKVRALQGIFDDIEQERSVEDFEEFMIAVARRSLRVRFVAPKQFARDGCAIPGEDRQQVHAVGWIGWIGLRAGSGKKRWHPVHADGDLFRREAPANTCGPGDERRNAQPSFQQFRLFPREGPGIGEAFTAVVAGENDDGVLCQSVLVQSL